METFILKLSVAVIPLVVLVASVTIISSLSSWYTHYPLSWHRSRHFILRALHGSRRYAPLNTNP